METEVRLDSLPVSSAFELVLTTTGRRITGKLLRKTACSCTVRLDRAKEYRTFERRNPVTGIEETVSIPIPSEVTHWSCGTLVLEGKKDVIRESQVTPEAE